MYLPHTACRLQIPIESVQEYEKTLADRRKRLQLQNAAGSPTRLASPELANAQQNDPREPNNNELENEEEEETLGQRRRRLQAEKAGRCRPKEGQPSSFNNADIPSTREMKRTSSMSDLLQLN